MRHLKVGDMSQAEEHRGHGDAEPDRRGLPLQDEVAEPGDEGRDDDAVDQLLGDGGVDDDEDARRERLRAERADPLETDPPRTAGDRAGG